jgi:hypothetical protein
MKAESVFSAEDLRDLAGRGITPATALAQIATFRKGLPFIALQRPCTVGDGIIHLSDTDLARYGASHTRAARQGRVMKFVPASGAASRMFQLLLAVMNRASSMSEEQIAFAAKAGDQECLAARQLVGSLKRFAFYDDLRALMARDGFDVDDLIARQHCQAILRYLLTPDGLNYANLPKALIKFHRYRDHTRTSLEEHVTEALAYAQDGDGVARLHLTVSPEHQHAVRVSLEDARPRYEQNGKQLVITFSEQKPSTDTIAVDHDNNPFRTADGNLVFRPGGHGALLANLQDLRGDLVFLKNIDNVVPDRLKAETYRYKQALGGYLVELQEQMFRHVHALFHSRADERVLAEALEFAQTAFAIVPPAQFQQASFAEKLVFLVGKLNRPVRVCGVVKNTGEPGGGPFWVTHPDGEVSVQIVESSQVDLQSAEQQEIWSHASHFNPVDLVCGMRDYLGHPFNLSQFVDPQTGFIAHKSKDGKELKALELPGLWNGAMAQWNTVFVEVPAITFNPVKTLFDLLRPEHQDL